MSAPGRLREIGGAFLRLGLISFGGPIAHLGYFHREFVERRRWLDEDGFGDLVALCQFLPGPASSQVAFGLGKIRGGTAGAVVASTCFALPSALLMILFAYGLTRLGGIGNAGWLHGLKLAAVAVVAQAVWSMGRRLCPDRERLTLAIASAAAVLLVPGSAVTIGVIAIGGLVGWCRLRGDVPLAGPRSAQRTEGGRGAMAALLAFGVLLLALPIAARLSADPAVAHFDSFYRAGSLVFGGGHVVLPLLRAELVPRGWIGDDAFLAGYGAAQALPGPLFTFAAYLGTVMHGGSFAWLGGLWCLLAIFLPAWLLMAGVLPFWARLRAQPSAQAALRGANATVVGVLLAAFYSPIWTTGVRDARDVATAFVGFALVEIWRLPPWLVVVLAAGAGEWLLR